jgi:hypothetical protein
VCQAVRAPGSNVTIAARSRAGTGASTIGSRHAVPVTKSEDIRRDGADPIGRASMARLLQEFRPNHL